MQWVHLSLRAKTGACGGRVGPRDPSAVPGAATEDAVKVFVTGGSGFVGGHLIEALVAAGHVVRAMARSERSADVVAGFGATPVRCDLEGVDAAALAGCEAVVHAAARVEDWGPEAAFRAANVEGTQRLLDAALEAGARRFVLVSTNATVVENLDLYDVDETRPYPAGARLPYPKTKSEAEALVLAAHGPELSTIAVRPCFIWGPRDASVLPTLQRIVADGGFAWMDGGRARVSTTHVGNLVNALVLAVESEETGACFVADEEDTTMRAFLGGLAETVGLELPDRSVPGALARGAAQVLDLTWRALGRTTPPPLTPMAAMLSSRSMTVRTDRARAVLGWQPVVSRAEGLAELRAGG